MTFTNPALTIILDNFDYGSRGGFIARLDLPGWGWQSYWGMNEREPGFFAALWYTGSWSPVPDYALVSGHHYYKYPGCLTLRIAEITGLSSLKVVRAMAIADPDPTLRADDQLTAALDDHPSHVAPDFQRGVGRRRAHAAGAHNGLRPPRPAGLLRRRRLCAVVGARARR